MNKNIRAVTIFLAVFASSCATTTEKWDDKKVDRTAEAPGDAVQFALCFHSEVLKSQDLAKVAMNPVAKTARVYAQFLDARLWEADFRQAGPMVLIDMKSASSVWGKGKIETIFDAAIAACRG